MPDRVRVAVLFGGRSCEHEVSVVSARSVIAAIDRQRYDVVMIGIDKSGRWLCAHDAQRLLGRDVVAGDDLVPVSLDYPGGGQLVAAGSGSGDRQSIDVVFPLLHGPFGEDGTVQGLLELAGVAYVGAGVGGSAVGMDKELSRRVFAAEGLPQVEYTVVRRHRWERERESACAEIESRFPYPVFVKPVSLGSSIGVAKAHDGAQLRAGIDAAAQYDYKIMVEAAAQNCREVEVAVLGNEEPEASVPGEIVPGHEFYDYSDKYLDDRSRLIVPARLGPAMTEQVRNLAVRAFRAVEGAGLARVDFFVDPNDQAVWINEINTMPGFTPISMFPRLWQASGLSYPQLVDRLIELALARHRDRQRTRTAL
jgi:D-alanine-D-alanine ligase